MDRSTSGRTIGEGDDQRTFQEVVEITRPPTWTAAACYAAGDRRSGQEKGGFRGRKLRATRASATEECQRGAFITLGLHQ